MANHQSGKAQNHVCAVIWIQICFHTQSYDFMLFAVESVMLPTSQTAWALQVLECELVPAEYSKTASVRVCVVAAVRSCGRESRQLQSTRSNTRGEVSHPRVSYPAFFYISGLRRNGISQGVTNWRDLRTRCAVEESQHFVPPSPPLLSPDVLLSTARVMVQYLANAGQGAVLDDGATIHGGDFVSSKPEQAKGRWVWGNGRDRWKYLRSINI